MFKLVPFSINTACSPFSRPKGSDLKQLVTCYIDELLIIYQVFRQHLQNFTLALKEHFAPDITFLKFLMIGRYSKIPFNSVHS